MLTNLLRFEWYYHTRRPLFYATISTFAILGFLAGNSGFSFPNVFRNSPYQVTYLTGLLTLAAIFSITLSVAQTFLREAEYRFDPIIYATPVPKLTYLFSRVWGIAGIAIISFTMGVAGLFFGQLLSWSPGHKTGVYSFVNYAWPLLVLAIPNIMLCIAFLCGTAWLTRSKLTVYVAGLMIYVLYIIASIFSNSPLIAGSTPSSPEQMSLFAKLDPLGMAAFFEQTRYWTGVERNTNLLSLSGNFLFNRLLWLSVSAIILVLSYLKFSFRSLQVKPPKARKIQVKSTAKHVYKPLSPAIHTAKHNLGSMFSFFRIDAVSIFKGIPFILILILWTALLGIEMSNAVTGDPRLGESYATTGLMITVIMDTLPLFGLLVILFYSSEVLWRSKSVGLHPIESTTPVNPSMVFLSRLPSLSIIPLFLLLYSCAIGMFMQVVKGFPVIEFHLYLSLFYYLGLPFLLCIVLVTGIQTATRSKYGGLTAAAIVILLTSTNIGRLIGVRHPLVRYADMLSVDFHDMNGFGAYTTAFHWKMLYWTALAVCLVMISGWIWNRGAARFGKMQKLLMVVCALVFFSSGGYIFHQTNIKHPYITETELSNWKQTYENKFGRYRHLPQPSITAVTTSIDLYPDRQRYMVSGRYQLVNKTRTPIDSLLVYIDRETQLDSISMPGAKLSDADAAFGHYWCVPGRPLQPGDSASIWFRFSSGWSPFNGHAAFNSIIDNGSFIRMSNYFPSFGYEEGNEITSSIERAKRKMTPQPELKKLEAALFDSTVAESYDYGFITLDAVVSTEKDQVAVGSGELVKQWTKDGRNYFHYKSDRLMPFRFAFSSARYAVKKDVYRNIAIEIYYDARHGVNVDSLISNAKSTLDYCETNFGSYPHKVLRFAEVSAFAEGFAATAYPGTIYMKENGGFYNNLGRGNQEDIINQLAGHELSHQWWGSAQLLPDQREGAWILTETLAKYTELMLYQRAHGMQASLGIVRQHIDQYLSSRSFSKEPPLYKTTYETPHLPYNKGTVVMHQLHQLAGEERVNKALRSLLDHHAFPKAPPSSADLLNELYRATPAAMHAQIDELFRQIIIYDSRLEEVRCSTSRGMYEAKFSGVVVKYNEDGNGKRVRKAVDSIEIGVYMENGNLQVQLFPVVNGTVAGTFTLSNKPVRAVMDPWLKTLDSFLADNEKTCD